jgi:pimeloyl-ACP methyl ester carboxylesterase
MQLTDWAATFLRGFGQARLLMIIYDNRDIGLVTKFAAAGMPDFAAVVQAAAAGRPAPLSYTL